MSIKKVSAAVLAAAMLTAMTACYYDNDDWPAHAPVLPRPAVPPPAALPALKVPLHHPAARRRILRLPTPCPVTESLPIG